MPKNSDTVQQPTPIRGKSNVKRVQVCSDRNKPNGQFLIPPELPAVLAFVEELPIRKVCGIGKVPFHGAGLGSFPKICQLAATSPFAVAFCRSHM